MTARYQIRHRSKYSYDQAVTTSFNEARLTPLATRWQTPLETALQVASATWQYRYVDYWGTAVRVFEVNTPHRDLVVEASSTVEIDTHFRPKPNVDLTWEAVRSPAVAAEVGEFLAQRPSTEPPPELAELAESTAARLGPHEAAYEVSAAVHEAMTYLPGSTEVHTLGSQAWEAGAGVCQDYAHLVVGALRHIGLPARYVSGYLHPSKNPELGAVVAGESHAWVQWWLGEWFAYDPTNTVEVAERHVMVGSGREYSDVAPIKGIVAGSPVTTDMRVEVDLTRLA